MGSSSRLWKQLPRNCCRRESGLALKAPYEDHSSVQVLRLLAFGMEYGPASGQVELWDLSRRGPGGKSLREGIRGEVRIRACRIGELGHSCARSRVRAGRDWRGGRGDHTRPD